MNSKTLSLAGLFLAVALFAMFAGIVMGLSYPSDRIYDCITPEPGRVFCASYRPMEE